MTLEHSTIDFVGAFAGALAVSIAMYLQFLREYHYSQPYIIGMYLLGGALLLLNLEPILVGTGYWRYVRLTIYLCLIAVEIVVFYDLYDGDPDIIESLRELRGKNTNR